MTNISLFTAITGFLSVVGCVSTPATRMMPDLSLVLPYTFELEDRKHLESPYVAKFEKDGKLLLYVASEHISIQKYPNLLEHPTLRTVAALFQEYNPQVVVVEGIDTGAELSPPRILKKADECKISKYKACGESFFAINEARRTGAAYISGEPKDKSIKDDIVKEGYTPSDLLGFYMVRQIPQYKRQGEFSRAGFADIAEKQLLRFRQQIGTTEQFGFKEFETWYSKNMSQPKSYLDITNNDPAPHGGKNATYVQKISNKVSLIRDRNIVQTIARMLESNSRVLVLYGGSHLITQEPALTKLMGQAKYFRTENKNSHSTTTGSTEVKSDAN